MSLGFCCLINAFWNVLPLLPVIVIGFASFILNPKKRSIEGKHVLITGGSSGIGLAAAHIAARRGAKVTIVARNVENLQKAQTNIEKEISSKRSSGKVQYFSADITGNDDQISKMVQEAESSFGPIYMLINCAGFAKASKFEDISRKDIEALVNINFMGSFLVSQQVVRSMKKQSDNTGGIIVFTSSQGGLFGLYGYTGYAASKGALVKLAEALHMEMKPYNITVTVSVPPDTDTPGFAEENKTKPTETALISAAAGVFKPEEVAEKLINDSLSGKFFSTIGFEGFMLTTLCAGIGPITHVLDFVFQVFLSGIFRSVSSFYLWNFGRIVQKEHAKRLASKKRE